MRGLKRPQASGVETPTRTELVGFDRKRKKKLSNAEWENPHDPESRRSRRSPKDGRTHFAYKAEQAVDLESGTILGSDGSGRIEGLDTESFGEDAERRPSSRWNRRPGTMPRSRRSLPTRATTATLFSPPSTSWAFAATSRSRTVVVVVGRARRTTAGHRLYANRRRIRGRSGQADARQPIQRGERLHERCLSLTSTGDRRHAAAAPARSVARTSSSASTLHACGCNLGSS